MNRTSRSQALLLLLFLTGCASESALGQVDVAPKCESDDLDCVWSGLDRPIAVGGRLPTRFDESIRGSSGSAASLESVAPNIVVVDGDVLVGVSPGIAAILVVDGESTVLDFVHVRIAEADGLIALSDRGRGRFPLNGRLELLAGDDVTLSAALESGAEAVSGEVETRFAVVGDSVTILDEGRTGQRRLVARHPGTSTVTITALSTNSTVTIEVLP